jgi:hypothetical protein
MDLNECAMEAHTTYFQRLQLLPQCPHTIDVVECGSGNALPLFT